LLELPLVILKDTKDTNIKGYFNYHLSLLESYDKDEYDDKLELIEIFESYNPDIFDWLKEKKFKEEEFDDDDRWYNKYLSEKGLATLIAKIKE
jgi:hypothetical protein